MGERYQSITLFTASKVSSRYRYDADLRWARAARATDRHLRALRDRGVELTNVDRRARSNRSPISAEVIFGMPDQRLSIRHDSGSSGRPYVDGALLAIRRVSTLVGTESP